MFVKGVKRKCSVRGCKNTDCFAISRTREVGNTVIICKSCLGKALGAIDDIDPKTKSNIPAVDNTKAPSLFFNAKALGKTETKNGLTADVVTVDENPTLTPDNGQGETTPPADVDDGNKVTPPAEDVPPVPGAEDGINEEAETVEPEEQTEPDNGSKDVPSPDLGDTASTADVQPHTCPNCGRSFDSKNGLNTHLRYCKPQTESK